MKKSNQQQEITRRDQSQNQTPQAYSPFRELGVLQRGIDRLFEDFLSPFSGAWPSAMGSSAMAFSPACDIEEEENRYMITFDLPGISKNDIQIEVRGNQLIVSGERRQEHEEKKKSRYFSERYYGSFVRSFALPPDSNPDQIRADYQDGVLRIELPRSEESKPKQIKIGEGGPSKQQAA